MDFPFRGFDVASKFHHGTCCRQRILPQTWDGDITFIRWAFKERFVLPPLSASKFVLLWLLPAAHLFFYSNAFAVELKQRIVSELVNEPKEVQIVYWMFREALNKQGASIPVEAISEVDYKKLIVELQRIGGESENFSMKLSPEKLTAELNMLASRVLRLADNTKTGRCAELPIDPASAARSGGDWRLVRKIDGLPIQPSSYEHWRLFHFFVWGCGGKKDFVTARKVLFEVSDLEPSDPSARFNLKSEVRHCQAEIWARYGVGGSASEELAQKFSRRFTMATFFFNHGDGPAEREKMAKRYPTAAANDFKCPIGHESSRIDPRNPWKDLW